DGPASLGSAEPKADIVEFLPLAADTALPHEASVSAPEVEAQGQSSEDEFFSAFNALSVDAGILAPDGAHEGAEQNEPQSGAEAPDEATEGAAEEGAKEHDQGSEELTAFPTDGKESEIQPTGEETASAALPKEPSSEEEEGAIENAALPNGEAAELAAGEESGRADEYEAGDLAEGESAASEPSTGKSPANAWTGVTDLLYRDWSATGGAAPGEPANGPESPGQQESPLHWLGVDRLENGTRSDDELPGMPVLGEEFLKMGDSADLGAPQTLDELGKGQSDPGRVDGAPSAIELGEGEAKAEIEATLSTLSSSVAKPPGSQTAETDDSLIDSILSDGEESSDNAPLDRFYAPTVDEAGIQDGVFEEIAEEGDPILKQPDLDASLSQGESDLPDFKADAPARVDGEKISTVANASLPIDAPPAKEPNAPPKPLLDRLNEDVPLDKSLIQRIKSGERINPAPGDPGSADGMRKNGEGEILFQNENFGIIRESAARASDEPIEAALADDLTGSIREVVAGERQAPKKAEEPLELFEGLSSEDALEGLVREVVEAPEQEEASGFADNPYKDHIIPSAFHGTSDESVSFSEDPQDVPPERRIPRNFQKSVNDSSAIVGDERQQDAAAIASDSVRASEPFYADGATGIKQQTESAQPQGEAAGALGKASGAQEESAKLKKETGSFSTLLEDSPPSSIGMVQTDLPINDFAQTGSIYFNTSDRKEEEMPNPGYSHSLVHGLRDGSADAEDSAQDTEGDEAFHTMNLFAEHTISGAKIPEADPTAFIGGSINESGDEVSLFNDDSARDDTFHYTFIPSLSEKEDLQAEPQKLETAPREFRIRTPQPSAAAARVRDALQTEPAAGLRDAPNPPRGLMPKRKELDSASASSQRMPLFEGRAARAKSRSGKPQGEATAAYGEDSPSQRPKKRAVAQGSLLKQTWARILLVAIVLGIGAAGTYLYRQNARYSEGVRLMNAGSYMEAIDVFKGLGAYKDSKEKAEECNVNLKGKYERAISLMGSGDFAGAMEIFTAIGSYEDSKSQKEACASEIKFANAVELLDRQEYFEAYQLFNQLGDFRQAAEKASSCIQPQPKTSYSFADRSYSKDNASLILRNPTGALNDLCIRLYAMDGTLVFTAYIRVGESLSARILDGDYKLNVAFGNDWFGEKDLFGEDGEYDTLVMDKEKQKEAISLKPGYISTYTFKSRREGNEMLKYIERAEF
ncbi:MAG: hypothetical protein LBC69_00335, partial [Eubacteriaceae bacterium]|nr:hypothetical protein [Eubacteriaceae bacterium]